MIINYSRITLLVSAIAILVSCNHVEKDWRKENMAALTPRLQSIFEKTKSVCFGRFVVDVPESATVIWGDTIVPLGVKVYPNGADKIKIMALRFFNEMKDKKALYHNRIPLLISESDVVQPPGKIITSYENFEAVNALKVNGYFELGKDGVMIDARPLKNEKDDTILLIHDIARRLRQRNEADVPSESGNCIEYAFLVDDPNPNKAELLEHIRIGFRLKEFSDAHFSIYVAPSNPDNSDDESLEAQWKRIKEDSATPEEIKLLANTKFFRESRRQIRDWKTGYEVLTRSPEEEGSHSHHDFHVRFTGVPNDPFTPYSDIQLQTGVADNAAGATKASLTDEEAIAVWDKITSTIRVLPTSAGPLKHAQADAAPRFALGELAATGRTCPQTGWWEPSESHNGAGSRRRQIKAGERMPHAELLGEPSLWQKFKGERPSYRTAVVWKLVDYADAPTLSTTVVDGRKASSPERRG